MRKILSLNNLLLNEVGYIYNLNCSEGVKKRLLDLGLVKDTCIVPVLKSVTGDPIAYEVRNIILAIRKQDADKIMINVQKAIAE